ncbi:EAL domain-containing protein [Rhodanobacter thiooxydans]|uniref:EAL domain-containing protein n=1 Tax=Rhodanobacter thiooxydans TaxID=416169 RepID=UPI000260E27F|nr:EAL domain-containing protein [Rhodanobacter thiooxydans]EIM00565.1 GAF sensor-containing diguanylate cyclase/phosphodiesterase [Rhodanobacter thiooxydans LCS2]MCW0203269.1 EAL domain-containing protein [Rhodanobacter thiooxydans]
MDSQQQAGGELRERFYRSVAETLALLHAPPDPDRRRTLATIAGILASTMDLPLVWIGRREPDRHDVEVVAAAGTAAAYASALKLSADESVPGGRGPVGRVLREERARATPVGAPEFVPWREAARRHGFGSCIAAASRTRDDGQLVLVAYSRDDGPSLSDELLDWAQRLVDELSRYWDHHGLLERSARMSRYRDAQRAIQRALLEQPDPAAVYCTLAEALADIAGAAAVDVFATEDDEPVLRRMALVGPLADVVRSLPLPPRYDDGAVVLAPTQAFMQGVPVIRRRSPGPCQGNTAFRHELLEHAATVGCWPLFASADAIGATQAPTGVFVVITIEPDAFDDEMCRLLDEIADATGLALRQHAQRHALLREQERQTYLALHDDLTGLPNRRALDRHLEIVLERARRRGRMVAVGLLDLDDLKPINDRHGHAVGDRLLAEMAERFRQMLRAGDYVARLGGDEFVLVFEDLDAAQDIDGLLERIGEVLRFPMNIDGTVMSVGASLGIALYSSEIRSTGEQLLRRADQAMYLVKSRKRRRSRWWSLVSPEGVVDEADEPDAATPYGEHAAALLDGCSKAWEPRLPGIVESFHAALRAHDGISRLLDVLPAEDLRAFEQHQMRHLRALLQGDLDLAGHRARATRTGLFHAACGLEEVWLLEAIEQLRDILAAVLAGTGQNDRRALAILLQRLGMERQWQLESMRELQRRRVALLARVNALAWSAEGYLELIQGVADILVSHKEIVACSAGRPDAMDQLTYEAVAGAAFAEYLHALVGGKAAPIRVDAGQPAGQGPSGRAWSTARIQRCAHYGSDPAMASWRDMALSLGVVSNVAIPLCASPLQPAVVLTVYSPYAGGFHSEDQRAFLEQIKTVLDLALARLAPPRQGTELLPFFVRERWRAMVATDALQMHYQPLVRLSDGRVAEIEALARLRDQDGELLAPARFLPALGADDLLALFRQGLDQAVACREALLRVGHALDVSVNAPAAALQDPRYAEVAAAVIARSGCAAQALLFEILESPIGTEHAAVPHGSGMQSLKALGVRLVEDDLGAGYSSLIRLRQWPFDRIKIDQAIVGQVRQDPLGTLRFIRQLIRIGHDLRLEVVVEGLESPELIEAATILGADFGQGYALARPMPADALSTWLEGYRPAPGSIWPQTGLGALAGELRWEEQFVALPPDPASWARLAQISCDPGEYLHRPELGEVLDASHQAMHRAALAGPADPVYRREREAFLALLVGHVLDSFQQ